MSDKVPTVHMLSALHLFGHAWVVRDHGQIFLCFLSASRAHRDDISLGYVCQFEGVYIVAFVHLPIDALEERMLLNLDGSICSQSLEWVPVEQINQKVFSVR